MCAPACTSETLLRRSDAYTDLDEPAAAVTTASWRDRGIPVAPSGESGAVDQVARCELAGGVSSRAAVQLPFRRHDAPISGRVAERASRMSHRTAAALGHPIQGLAPHRAGVSAVRLQRTPAWISRAKHCTSRPPLRAHDASRPRHCPSATDAHVALTARALPQPRALNAHRARHQFGCFRIPAHCCNSAGVMGASPPCTAVVFRISGSVGRLGADGERHHCTPVNGRTRGSETLAVKHRAASRPAPRHTAPGIRHRASYPS